MLIFYQDDHERHLLSDPGCAGSLSAKIIAIYRPSGSKKASDLDTEYQNKLSKRYPKFILNLGILNLC